MIDELGERVISAIYEENHGNPYQRINVIRSKCLDAILWPALGEEFVRLPVNPHSAGPIPR